MTVIAFHKPYDVLSKFTDQEGRSTLGDYITLPDIYPAGRLDKDSEGLLLLTDDGGLASQITHPRHQLEKVYWAQVERIPDETALQDLREGVVIKGKKTRPAKARILDPQPDLPERSTPIRYRANVPDIWIELTISEGRNRQVRRMTAGVGHPTLRLIRVGVGPIRLGDLPAGEWRTVTDEEFRKLKKMLR